MNLKYIYYPGKNQLKKLKIAEDLLNKREDKIAVIELVNELLFTAQN